VIEPNLIAEEEDEETKKRLIGFEAINCGYIQWCRLM